MRRGGGGGGRREGRSWGWRRNRCRHHPPQRSHSPAATEKAAKGHAAARLSGRARLIKKKKGCVKPEPQVTKCEPPKIKTRKGCVYPAPETASCEWPMVKSGKGCDCAAGYTSQHGECVKKDDQEVADCEWPMVKSGRGCDCAPRISARQHGECVKKEEVADCRWPMIKLGKGCICAPGLIPANGTCIKPPTIVVDPGDDGPPGVGPTDEMGAGHGAPPPPPPQIQAEEPAPKPKSKSAVAAISPSQIRCLPQDLYDLMVEAYGKRPSVGPCPTACLPKPAYFSTPKLDAIAAKSGIVWCEDCVQVGAYMPLAAVLKLEKLAHVTICVAPDSCVYPDVSRRGGRAESRDPHRVQGPPRRRQERGQSRRRGRQPDLSRRAAGERLWRERRRCGHRAPHRSAWLSQGEHHRSPRREPRRFRARVRLRHKSRRRDRQAHRQEGPGRRVHLCRKPRHGEGGRPEAGLSPSRRCQARRPRQDRLSARGALRQSRQDRRAHDHARARGEPSPRTSTS